VVTIAGMRESGKTTLIREIFARLWAEGKKSAVIVYDEGKEDYSSNFLEVHGVKIFSLRRG